MFTLSDLILVALGAGLLAYWWRISGQKAAAMERARHHCEQRGLQLLDQSLVFARYRLERDYRGHRRLCRLYEFDFCSDGEERYKGMVMLTGYSVLRIVLQTSNSEVTEF